MHTTDTLTTAQLISALLERTTFTNGLDFCSARDVCSLLAALEQHIAIPPLPAPVVAPSVALVCPDWQPVTTYIMLWYAEGQAEDYEEYSQMRTERERVESILSEHLTPEDMDAIYTICETQF
jgi:hypothetical protein